MIANESYLTAGQVLRRYSITDMTLWRWLRNEELAFPQPTKINGRRYFKEAELSTWERARAGKAVA